MTLSTHNGLAGRPRYVRRFIRPLAVATLVLTPWLASAMVTEAVLDQTFEEAIGQGRPAPADPGTFASAAAMEHTAAASALIRLPDALSVGSGDLSTPVSAVPEPTSYMLMLAGLGAIVFVVRRRRPAGDSAPQR